jgi:hypothetical protein
MSISSRSPVASFSLVSISAPVSDKSWMTTVANNWAAVDP